MFSNEFILCPGDSVQVRAHSQNVFWFVAETLSLNIENHLKTKSCLSDVKPNQIPSRFSPLVCNEKSFYDILLYVYVCVFVGLWRSMLFAHEAWSVAGIGAWNCDVTERSQHPRFPVCSSGPLPARIPGDTLHIVCKCTLPFKCLVSII